MNESESKSKVLNSQQEEALKFMEDGVSIALVSPAGTGKSFLIEHFVSRNKLCETPKNIGLTSTTGTSAILIGGKTLHSYLGIYRGDGHIKQLLGGIRRNKAVLERWLTVDVLVIDEVSMLSMELFDKLEELARHIRATHLPFGGIQIILSGDFLQLPVIGSSHFCFEGNGWKRCVKKVFCFDEIVRQKDKLFQRCLNEVRFAKISDDVKEILNSRIGVVLEPKNDIKPTVLYAKNCDVDSINNQELLNMKPSCIYEYSLVMKKCKKNVTMAVDKLELAIDCQIMLIVNLDFDNGLVNGSRGIVVGFDDNDLPIVRFLNGVVRTIDYHTWTIDDDKKCIGSITQIPLKLCWAMTCHKSQGVSLDNVIISLEDIFSYGQAYVALSRVRTLDGLSIIDIDYDSIKSHPKAVLFYENVKKSL